MAKPAPETVSLSLWGRGWFILCSPCGANMEMKTPILRSPTTPQEEWIHALLDGRIASAQYLELDVPPRSPMTMKVRNSTHSNTVCGTIED